MRTVSISRIALFSAVAAAAFVAPASAQKREEFTWNRALAAGRTIEIKGVNGAIKASLTNGSDVRVKAEKTAKKSNVTEVKIEVLETPNGVTICAVYPTPQRMMRRTRPNECVAGDRWNTNTENNDVEVNWTIEVPRGVNLSAQTVNGDVEARNMQGEVRAETVNGSVNVSTSGIAHAKTVNGSLDIVMGRTNWTNNLHFETVNGAVKVSFPGDLNTQVSAETVNGDIDTDWPLTVRGRFGSKNLNGMIGNGGRMLSLSTVNGDIEIRKGK